MAEYEDLQASSTSYVCSAFTSKWAQTLILALQKPVLKCIRYGRSLWQCRAEPLSVFFMWKILRIFKRTLLNFYLNCNFLTFLKQQRVTWLQRPSCPEIWVLLKRWDTIKACLLDGRVNEGYYSKPLSYLNNEEEKKKKPKKPTKKPKTNQTKKPL